MLDPGVRVKRERSYADPKCGVRAELSQKPQATNALL